MSGSRIPGSSLRLVHPDDRDRVRRAAAATWANADRSVELPARLPRRPHRLGAGRGRRGARRSGRPLCVQGYLLDVSERKTAERQQGELRAAEAAAAEAHDRQRKIDFVAEAAARAGVVAGLPLDLGEVAALAVRELADWCVVDVLEEDGSADASRR